MAQRLVDFINRLSLPNRPATLKINKEINRGAWGVVYAGLLDDQPVAVKAIHELLKDAKNGESVIVNFCEECDRLKKVEHPHVIKCLGAFKDTDLGPILVMEKMEENLQQFLGRHTDKLSLHEQLHISLQITKGVAFLHQLKPPMVHRDLNDKNVLLSSNGIAKIGDFGQSKLKQKLFLTTKQPGMVLFMPPEALKADCEYDESLDVFSLGVLMLEIGTQQQPCVDIIGIGATPEVKRREKDLERMNTSHPLKSFILLCLDEPQLRPKAAVLEVVLVNLEEAQQRLEGMQNELTKANSRVQQLTGSLSEEEKCAKTLQENLENMKQELAGTQLQLQGAYQRLEGKQQELEQTRQELRGVQQDLEGKEQKLRGVQQDLEGKEQELREAHQEHGVAIEALHTKERKLEAKNEELMQAQVQLRDLHSELKVLHNKNQQLAEAKQSVILPTIDRENGVDSGTPVDAEPISGHAVTKMKRKGSSSQYIVAIDIGSTSTKVATVTLEQPKNLDIFNRWPLADGKTQVPTAVVYKLQDKKAQCVAFGQEAIDNEEGPLFINFLGNLREKKFATDTKVTSVGGNSEVTVSLPALKLFEDILKNIVFLVKKHLERADKNLVVEKDIKWVLTVPNDSARFFMRQAATKSGLQRHRLTLVSSMEATFSHIAWLQQIDESMTKANKYMVVTTGAEAIGVSTSHDKEHAISLEPPCGASAVNQEFLHFLHSLDVPSYPDFFQEAMENAHILKRLLQNFEASKAKFDGSHEMSIELPLDIFRLYEQQQPPELLNDALTQLANPMVYVQTNRLHVSPKICLKWYEPTISRIIKLVDSLYSEHQVEALFVVGGFAKCKILSQQLKQEYPKLPLVMPEGPDVIVAKGALRYCMQLLD